MSAQIVIGRRCPKTNENPVGWEEISLQNITFDKPTVLCLSGDGTLTAKDANAMAKYAEQLLGRKGLEGKDDIQILSAYYKNANAHEMTNSRLCRTKSLLYFRLLSKMHQKNFYTQKRTPTGKQRSSKTHEKPKHFELLSRRLHYLQAK